MDRPSRQSTPELGEVAFPIGLRSGVALHGKFGTVDKQRHDIHRLAVAPAAAGEPRVPLASEREEGSHQIGAGTEVDAPPTGYLSKHLRDALELRPQRHHDANPESWNRTFWAPRTTSTTSCGILYREICGVFMVASPSADGL
jgi:hypothetical protein